MFRAKTVYEAKVGDRFFQFICEPTEPVDNVIAVLEVMLRDAKAIKDQAVKDKEQIEEVSQESIDKEDE